MGHIEFIAILEIGMFWVQVITFFVIQNKYMKKLYWIEKQADHKVLLSFCLETILAESVKKEDYETAQKCMQLLKQIK